MVIIAPVGSLSKDDIDGNKDVNTEHNFTFTCDKKNNCFGSFRIMNKN